MKLDPKQFGYNAWDGITLSAYIKERFGVDYSVRSCGGFAASRKIILCVYYKS